MEGVQESIRALSDFVSTLPSASSEEASQDERETAMRKMDAHFLRLLQSEALYGDCLRQKEEEVLGKVKDESTSASNMLEELAAEARAVSSEIATVEASLGDAAKRKDFETPPSRLLETAIQESKDCETTLESLRKRKREEVAKSELKKKQLVDANSIAAESAKGRKELETSIQRLDYNADLRTPASLALPTPLYLINAQANALKGVFDWSLTVELASLPLLADQASVEEVPFVKLSMLGTTGSVWLEFAYNEAQKLLFVRASHKPTPTDGSDPIETLITDNLSSLDKRYGKEGTSSRVLPSPTISSTLLTSTEGKAWLEWGRPFCWCQSLGGIFVFPYFSDKPQVGLPLSTIVKEILANVDIGVKPDQL